MKTRKVGERFRLDHQLFEVAIEIDPMRGGCAGCAALLDKWAERSKQIAECEKFNAKGGACLDCDRTDGVGVIFKRIKEGNNE